jgi:hypothetical protein
VPLRLGWQAAPALHFGGQAFKKNSAKISVDELN